MTGLVVINETNTVNVVIIEDDEDIMVVGSTTGATPAVGDTVKVMVLGTEGPAGQNGASVSDFIFTQSSPLAEWVVNHNLGFKPSVTVYSTGGVEVDAQVVHMSDNQCRIFFAAAYAGSARCV